MELSSICDAVLRTHEGLKPNKMIQIYSNSKEAFAFAKFANIHSAFGLYRKFLMHGDMKNFGAPLARHMFFHYWNDKIASQLHDQVPQY